MRKIEAIIIVIVMLIFLATLDSFATQQNYDSIVDGKNKPEHDIKAVQEAVNKGGSVLLKGLFNFGQKGRVNIKNDIEITGESDSKGSPLTKIKGGFWTFHSPLPTTELPFLGPGPKIKIKNIHFDGATWTPMHFPYTSGAEISGNNITNIQPHGVPYKWPGGEKLLFSAGALFGTRYVHREKNLPGAVTGNLIFENNKIDLKCENPEITLGHGVLFLWTWGAIIEIKGNRIRNASRDSIGLFDNYLNEEGRGSLVIAENNIVTPTVGIPFPSPSTSNGIVVGWFFDMTGGSDPSKNSKITVIRNYVQTNGEASTGILSLSDGVAILGNRVESRGGSKSNGIRQLGSNAFIARNKIDGIGAFAVQASPFKVFKGSGNTFAWNDVREFKASSGDFLAVGNNNTIVGQKYKVVDKGQGNKIFDKY
jgi:hypothetical protein